MKWLKIDCFFSINFCSHFWNSKVKSTEKWFWSNPKFYIFRYFMNCHLFQLYRTWTLQILKGNWQQGHLNTQFKRLTFYCWFCWELFPIDSLELNLLNWIIFWKFCVISTVFKRYQAFQAFHEILVSIKKMYSYLFWTEIFLKLLFISKSSLPWVLNYSLFDSAVWERRKSRTSIIHIIQVIFCTDIKCLRLHWNIKYRTHKFISDRINVSPVNMTIIHQRSNGVD